MPATIGDVNRRHWGMDWRIDPKFGVDKSDPHVRTGKPRTRVRFRQASSALASHPACWIQAIRPTYTPIQRCERLCESRGGSFVVYTRQMNYPALLEKAEREYTDARALASLAEARRDDLIRAAHSEGRLTVRQIGAIVGLSFQRVATIVAGDLDRPSRPTLHGAMTAVLAEHRGDWMSVHELARAIYEGELYQRKDRGVIPPGQIRARAAKYPDLFEGSTDGSNRVRLHQEDVGSARG